MIFFDISDTSIEVVQLSRSFLRGEAVSAFARMELDGGLVRGGEIQNREKLVGVMDGLMKSAKPKAIRDVECGFTLSDRRVYTYRFQLPRYQSNPSVNIEPLNTQAEKLVPQPLEQLTRITTPVSDKKGSSIIWIAVPTEILLSYEEIFRDLNLNPKIAVPESYAIYALLAPTVGEEEIILYLDVGKRISTATFMDRMGVIETFSEPVQTAKLLTQVGQLLEFCREHLGREASRIVLGGGGSLKIDPNEAARKLQLNVARIDTALERFKPSIRTDFGGLPRVLFANVLGLIALNSEESSPNLLKEANQPS